VVWGISATVERFNEAMKVAFKRSHLPDVLVDSTKVQDSGLIKDTILIDIPDDVGEFDTVLVRRATDKLKASTEAWAEYATQQEDSHPVVPLMVLQVPNTPDPNDIGRALDTIYQQWPDMPSGCVANVLGEHNHPTVRQSQCAVHLARACAGFDLGACAYRQGRHQYGLGLPAS